VNVAERLTEAGNALLDRQQKGASTTLATPIEPKLFLRSGFAISCIGHVAILAIGLIFAGANPFDSVPADAITVEIVSPNEVGAGAGNPGTAPAGPEIAPSSEPAAEPAASASQPQATPSSTPQAAAPSTPQPTPPSTPRATTPPDQRTTRQALAPAQPLPSTPSSMPWFQPPPDPAPPAETQELNPGDMFGMPLTLPDGRVGGSYDSQAVDLADVSSDSVAALRGHLKNCLTLPKSVSRTSDLRLKMRVSFQPNGMLDGEPVLIGGSPMGPRLKDSVIEGLRACQPYAMLPADKYKEWREVDITFTPQDFGR
jgi:hypothetical protein